MTADETADEWRWLLQQEFCLRTLTRLEALTQACLEVLNPSTCSTLTLALTHLQQQRHEIIQGFVVAGCDKIVNGELQIKLPQMVAYNQSQQQQRSPLLHSSSLSSTPSTAQPQQQQSSPSKSSSFRLVLGHDARQSQQPNQNSGWILEQAVACRNLLEKVQTHLSHIKPSASRSDPHQISKFFRALRALLEQAYRALNQSPNRHPLPFHSSLSRLQSQHSITTTSFLRTPVPTPMVFEFYLLNAKLHYSVYWLQSSTSHGHHHLRHQSSALSGLVSKPLEQLQHLFSNHSQSAIKSGEGEVRQSRESKTEPSSTIASRDPSPDRLSLLSQPHEVNQILTPVLDTIQKDTSTMPPSMLSTSTLPSPPEKGKSVQDEAISDVFEFRGMWWVVVGTVRVPSHGVGQSPWQIVSTQIEKMLGICVDWTGGAGRYCPGKLELFNKMN